MGKHLALRTKGPTVENYHKLPNFGGNSIDFLWAVAWGAKGLVIESFALFVVKAFVFAGGRAGLDV